MARSISTIQNLIISEKNKRLELDELESDSKTSIYNGWAYICAVVMHSAEVLQDIFKDDIVSILDAQKNGIPQFYVNKAYEFQDGDTVTVSDDGYSVGYNTINTDNIIVTRASYEETTISGENLDKLLLLKVAKGDTGALSPLSAEELIRLTAYIEQIKFTGTNIQITSKTGDILIPHITVYHDGLISESDMYDRLDEAINGFMEQLSFDSALYVTKLFDAIQEVDNVTDVYIDVDATEPQGVFLRGYDDNGVMGEKTEVKRVAHLTSGYLKQSSKQGQEVDVPRFTDSIILKSE